MSHLQQSDGGGGGGKTLKTRQSCEFVTRISENHAHTYGVHPKLKKKTRSYSFENKLATVTLPCGSGKPRDPCTDAT